MKNLLSTTALLAGLAFSGAAFAQEATTTPSYVYNSEGFQLYTVENVNGATFSLTKAEFDTAMAAGPATPTLFGGAELDASTFTPAIFTNSAPESSLLSTILGDAERLTATITNVAENLATLDASIDINTTRSYVDIGKVVTDIGGLGTEKGFGSFAQTSATNFARDFEFPDLAFLAPMTAEFGDLATTAIGSLQSGNMDVNYASGLVADVSSRTEGVSTSAETMGQTFGAISGVSFQNISFNGADKLDAGITLMLNDVNSKVGDMATTAIGALGSGNMVADLVGGLVGQPAAAESVTPPAVVTPPAGDTPPA